MDSERRLTEGPLLRGEDSPLFVATSINIDSVDESEGTFCSSVELPRASRLGVSPVDAYCVLTDREA